MRNRRPTRRRNIVVDTITNKNFIIISSILLVVIIASIFTIQIRKQIDKKQIAKQAEELEKVTGEIFTSVDENIKESSEPSESATKIAKISAVGDILCQMDMIEDAKGNDSYDFTHMFSNITKYTQNSDLTIGTLETNFVEENYSGSGKYNSPKEFLDAVKKSGVGLVSVAHNHGLDYGTEGLTKTVQTIQEKEIAVTGIAGNAENENAEFTGLIKEIRGIKVAFLAYTYGLSNENSLTEEEKKQANIYTEELVQKDMEYAKENSNYIIVLMHWGDVNSSNISENQKNITSFLVKQGVDMILGAHPSVVEPMEIIQNEEGRNVLVAYSLGNYISTLKYQNADVEIILNIQIAKEADSEKAVLQKVDYTPIYMLDNGKNAENRYELADMKLLAYNYANGDESKITRKKYDEIISKLEKLKEIVEK